MVRLLSEAGASLAVEKTKIMKKLILPCLLTSVLGALSGCASDEPQTTSSSTTTEETTVQPVTPTTTTTTQQTTVQPANQ